MKTLADIDLLAYKAPGLAFRRVTAVSRARVALICSDDRGATELWTSDLDALPESVRDIPSVRESGGVDVHSPVAADDLDGPEDGCSVLPDGGPCWSGGVSLVGLPFPTLIANGYSLTLLRLLAERHERAFGGAP